MPLPEAFVLSITNRDERAFVAFDDTHPFMVKDHERATRFSTRRCAEEIAERFENDLAKGAFFTVCDQDGWPILETIDLPILTLADFAEANSVGTQEGVS